MCWTHVAGSIGSPLACPEGFSGGREFPKVYAVRVSLHSCAIGEQCTSSCQCTARWKKVYEGTAALPPIIAPTCSIVPDIIKWANLHGTRPKALLTPWCQTLSAFCSSSSVAFSLTSSLCQRRAKSWPRGLMSKLNSSFQSISDHYRGPGKDIQQTCPTVTPRRYNLEVLSQLPAKLARYTISRTQARSIAGA